MTLVSYSQELCTRTLICGLVYDEKPLKIYLWNELPIRFERLFDINGLSTNMGL